MIENIKPSLSDGAARKLRLMALDTSGAAEEIEILAKEIKEELPETEVPSQNETEVSCFADVLFDIAAILRRV